MSDDFIPSTPNPDYVTIVAGLFRTFLAVAGSAGFTWALTVNASQIEMVASAACILGAAVWSAWQKVAAARAQHAAATASASKRKPVEPPPPTTPP